MKKYITSSLVITLLLTIFSCKQIDKKILIANYEIDKYIPIDTLQTTKDKIENSRGWTICLKDSDVFQIRKTDTIINGSWTIQNKEGKDYTLKFQFENGLAEARINANIIYFDTLNKMLDSIFNYVLFVQTTKKIE